MERAVRDRAVAEERNRDTAVGPELRGCGRADRDRQAGRDDSVGAEDPEVRIGDVHRAAPPTVRALVLAHELGEHAERVETLGETVAVAAMGRRDDVGPAEGRHAPTAAASCPIDRWTKPGTSPSRYSAATRSSNPRITSIRRCISRISASENMSHVLY